MNDVSLRCQCGQVQGTAHAINASDGTRVVCCCDDCQAFAKHLGAQHCTLDPFGGTEVFQVTQAQITIEQGIEHLQCLRLTPKGVLRWYSDCCNTPLANTIKASSSFVGIIRSFMPMEQPDELLGPVRAYVQTQHAIGTPNYPKSAKKFPITLIGRMIRKILLGKLKGQHSPSVFYGHDGRPRVKPTIVNA